MKGSYFQRPLEFKLDVQGESWNQGDTISGTLTVKSHGAAPAALQELRVELSRGELKKVRAKSADAFELLKAAELPRGVEIAAQSEISFPWSFQTTRNSPITDAVSSLFLVYGAGQTLGQLQLNILPYGTIQEILQVFKTDFRFIEKSKKFVKGALEVKLDPPDGRGFATVDLLVLSFQFKEEVLELKYNFAVKKIEASAAAVDLKKDKKTFEQSFAPADYRTTSGRFNHEKMEASIREIIRQVESKVLL